jgi:serine protease
MAVPHVAAAAALVIASGVLGTSPTPAQVVARLKQTARDLGEAGRDDRFGWGLLDAGAATAPTAPAASQRTAPNRRSRPTHERKR